MTTSYKSLPGGQTGIPESGGAIPEPFADVDGQLVISITTSVALALILWEYATLLPDEIRLYRKSVWGTIPPYAFLGLRYGGILVTLPSLFLVIGKTTACQTVISTSQAGGVLVVASSAIIFALRTSLSWGDNRIVRATLGTGVLLMAACWVAVATQFRSELSSTPRFGSNCYITPTVHWIPLANAASTIFFITVLVLTLLKMHYHHPRDSLIAYRIYRNNLLYLLGTTMTAATALVLESLSPAFSVLSLSTASIATVFTVAFGTRAFRNLMLATLLEAERAHGFPYPSSSPIISHTSEIRYAHPAPTRPSPIPVSRAHQSRPHTAGSTDAASTAHLNPNTSFPSPPSSYSNHSILSSPSSSHSPLSHSPLSISPLRRGALRQIPEPPRSEWSDSL
ncbi:hypothetical protein DFH07DRAFT_956163 [Mycena maculata]|uniref:DUF6533 domain-containing protein n=1 Tax=Mycena maculata TaxID=230809 RepID=A0AAD7JG83_9AGAR|nr:hypothetical protein DFH07DRAFT_956163 [Mycena maculata]